MPSPDRQLHAENRKREHFKRIIKFGKKFEIQMVCNFLHSRSLLSIDCATHLSINRARRAGREALHAEMYRTEWFERLSQKPVLRLRLVHVCGAEAYADEEGSWSWRLCVGIAREAELRHERVHHVGPVGVAREEVDEAAEAVEEERSRATRRELRKGRADC